MPLNGKQLRHAQETWMFGHGPYSVDFADLGKLDINDPRLTAAFARRSQWQVTDIAPATMALHGRAPVFDGEYGPAVQQMLDAPRCSVPDRLLPSPLDSQLPQDMQEVVKKLREPKAARGRGFWYECHGVENAHCMIVEMNMNNLPANMKRELRPNWTVLHQVLLDAQVAKASFGLLRRYRLDGKDFLTGERLEGNTNSNMTFVTRSTGWIGLAIVGNNETCNSTIWMRFLGTYLRSESDIEKYINMWWKLQCHEEGHNESSGHIVGDPIMNPSIVNTRTENRINRSSGYGKFLVREYGGEAVGHPDPGPDPEPPKDPIQKQIDDLSRELNANRIKDVIQGVHLELLQNRVAELEAKHER